MFRSLLRPRLRRTLAAAAATAVGAALLTGTPAAAEDDRPWLDTSLSPEIRAYLLVNQMTLEEKSGVLYGYGTRVVGDQTWQVYVKGIERLGVPDMVQGDSPVGIYQGTNAATQMPASVALGATFSRTDAYTYGDVLGAEFRATGYGVLHGPNVDVQRDPRHGRAFETYGEDPYLTGALATEYVKGAQSNDIIADAKHYAVNTQETNRQTVDVNIDKRTLHELYLAPFQNVVQDGDIGMIMCAYNKINTVYACDNEYLMQDVLRDRWGFDGIVRTDAGAAHQMESLLIGLDQEFRSVSQFGQKLIDAVRAGTIAESAVDDTVRRIFRTMIEYGIFDNPPQRTGADLPTSAQKAQQLAESSAVLLRNERKTLPFDAATTDRIAVIGTNVDDTLTGGGPSNPAPQGKDTILQAVKDRVPGATVDYQPGVDPVYSIAMLSGYPQIPSGALAAADGARGATATYTRADGSQIATRTDACLCSAPASSFLGTILGQQAMPSGTAGAVWTSRLTADKAGTYGFDVAAAGTAKLYLDGKLVIDATNTTAAPKAASLHLRKGAHDIKVEFTPSSASAQLKVGWKAPAGAQDANIAAAVEAARKADVAVVSVRDVESEGSDRPSLTLPNDQDRLIAAVTAANPRTVVVVNTGAAITMPWNGDVGAILQAWYGGTRGGAAIARLLFGDVNPSGRLPVSFPKKESHLPTYTVEQFPGVNLVATYSEGLSTGYRYYNAPKTPDALYPFGYGLSYTKFNYANLKIDRTAFQAGTAGADGTLRGQYGLTATFKVKNTGKVAGSVVPQIYVEYPKAAGEPAPLLKGFEKVELAPGESKTVTIPLDQRAFSVYDGQADTWTVPTGNYKLHVGDSSTDYRLSTTVKVTR
ncbi:glycoside hydrolase family 3 C-terminal domain-containing protein [Phytohabitans sp. ZYX-F-186]|uniref:Glycoside hydrolase family 3 C-terminal domain-containing protein n=1 Tax=Phytohabitans maris TaxID=3071409 RepID=A0ABU0Z9G4_9ACTN|nr:glycoside hydrolase family 3 C-terminal domain-containing protein [Phytohabitans sp. ZYX-F-186]MDQ7903690.1 glycoside hydrolase family 3 C-terminal domain-containing protein [Phytohabitans sp. ZYX-F-186]